MAGLPKAAQKRVENSYVIQIQRDCGVSNAGSKGRCANAVAQVGASVEVGTAPRILSGQRIGPELELHDLTLCPLAALDMPDEMRAVVPNRALGLSIRSSDRPREHPYRASKIRADRAL